MVVLLVGDNVMTMNLHLRRLKTHYVWERFIKLPIGYNEQEALFHTPKISRIPIRVDYGKGEIC